MVDTHTHTYNTHTQSKLLPVYQLDTVYTHYCFHHSNHWQMHSKLANENVEDGVGPRHYCSRVDRK